MKRFFGVLLLVTFLILFGSGMSMAHPQHNNGVMRWDDGYRPFRSHESWESLAHRWCDPHPYWRDDRRCRPDYWRYDQWRPYRHDNHSDRELILFFLFQMMVNQSGMDREYHMQDDRLKELEYNEFQKNKEVSNLVDQIIDELQRRGVRLDD